MGSEVVKQLRESGDPVRAAMTRPGKGADGDVAFDFGAPQTWPAAFARVGRLFLMRPQITDVKTYIRPVIRYAASHGVRQLVFLSVLGVNRLFPHRQVERDIEASGLPNTFLRPAFFSQT